VSVNTNTGLLAALVLTIVVPFLFDASTSPQTNAYIVTNPAWVGQVYFTLGFYTALCLFCATLGSIGIIILLNETTSEHECRYYVGIAQQEALYSVKMLVLGMAGVYGCFLLWLVIVNFQLNTSQDCMDNGCGSFALTFAACIALACIILLHGVHVAVNMVAKLHKAHHKFHSADTNVGEWFLQMNAKQLWAELHSYLELVGPNSSSIGFREYLVSRAPGKGAICTHTDELACKLFDAKIAQMIEEDHASLLKELDTLAASDSRYASYPRELS